jgi:tetratricopeptide (TPR) repeat protein
VQERLRRAEVARVEAQTKAAEERKRWRLTVALAAAVIGLVVLGGGGWAYLARQRAERRAITERGVTAALAEARVWRDQARTATATGNLEPWAAALGAARHAHDLVAQGEADAALRDRVNAEMLALEREQEEAKAERRLLDQLETIRGSRSEHWDPKRTDAEYAAAFRAVGIDLDQLDPNEAGKRIGQRTAVVELASYLDDWAMQRRTARDEKDEASWRRLLAAAQVADRNPWRVALREQIGRDREALLRLAADPKTLETQPAPSLALLASALMQERDRDRAEQILRRAWRLKPSDFWINFALGGIHWAADHYNRPEEAARFLSGAVAIRPRSYAAHNDLGLALRDHGKLEEAIAQYHEAIRIKADHFKAHHNLGLALSDQGKLAEAIAEYREAIRLKPEYSEAHNNLGKALVDQGEQEEGIAELRAAIRRRPENAKAHYNLGNVLERRGALDEAIAELRTALRHQPDHIYARGTLALVLRGQGRLDEAIAELRAAILIRPDDVLLLFNLGRILKDQGKLDEAIAAYRTALRLKPDYAEAHCNLGHVLRQQGRYAEALAELKCGHELGSMNPNWRYPSTQWLRETERQAFLAARLPAILAGQLQPADAAEALGFAQLCYDRRLQGASARLWTEAFRAQPKLAEDMRAQLRYNAACAAALAGSGQGKDDPTLDESAKARWRKQALDWLKSDLAAWSKIPVSGPPQARQSVAQTLQHWKADLDLAGMRDPAALAKLPEAEQNACRALWAEVDALLAKARGDTAP